MGGGVSIDFSSRFPNVVKALVVIDTAPEVNNAVGQIREDRGELENQTGERGRKREREEGEEGREATCFTLLITFLSVFKHCFFSCMWCAML